MCNLTRFGAVVLTAFGILPGAVYAQGSLTGVAKDSSGAVLPGVTVEASSPVLIEKVRTVITDRTGQYRIIDLRPGTYSVTFTLPGFSTVRLEGIELTGSFVATVNADMRVGAVQETLTVTGETPVVDVQTTARQRVVAKDVIDALPAGRSYLNLAVLLPGLQANAGGAEPDGRRRDQQPLDFDDDDSRREDGRHAGAVRRARHPEHRLRGPEQQLHPRYRQHAGSDDRLLVRRAELPFGGVLVNHIPREGGNRFNVSFFGTAVNSVVPGQQLYPGAQGRRPHHAERAVPDVRHQPVGRRSHREGQAVVLHLGSLAGQQELHRRRVREPERGRSQRVDLRSRSRATAASTARRRTARRPGSRGRRAEEQVLLLVREPVAALVRPARQRLARGDPGLPLPAGVDRPGRVVVSRDQPSAARRTVLEPRRESSGRATRGTSTPRSSPSSSNRAA